MTLIIAATGHRPDKLGGYGRDNQLKLVKLAYDYLEQMRPDGAITGLALGWDMAFAEAARLLCIPLHGAVPFEGQESRWPAASQAEWRRLVNACSSVTVVSPGAYHVEKMQIRNEWMVDRCDRLCALWNGTAGGTGNCMRYAQNDPLVQIDNLWFKWQESR